MARESFLINPVRRGRKRRSVSTRSKKKGLPSTLLSRMMRKHGRKTGMKKAWSAYRAGARKNPLGEEVLIVGANPRRRRRRVKRTNVWAGQRAGHARAARKGWSKHRRSYTSAFAKSPRKRRRARRRRLYAANPRRRIMRDNPRRRARRRMRRNPAMAGTINIMRPMTLIMPIATGIVANMAITKIPTMLNIVSPWPRRAVQIAIMAAGNLFLKRFIGSTNAMVWTVVSGVTIATELLNTYVFKTALSYVEGIPSLGMGAYPQEIGMGAVTDYSEDYGVGAFPYGDVVQY